MSLNIVRRSTLSMEYRKVAASSSPLDHVDLFWNEVNLREDVIVYNVLQYMLDHELQKITMHLKKRSPKTSVTYEINMLLKEGMLIASSMFSLS